MHSPYKTNFRLTKSLLVVVFLLSVALCASAQQKTRVLFIGNSYTYFNNLPEILVRIGESSQPPQAIEAEMVTRGGATLQGLWDEGAALKTLRQGRWDYVVLQEQSTLGDAGTINGVVQINNPAAFFAASRLWDAEIKKNGAKTVFYMTWARQNSPEFQQKLTDAYETVAKELHAEVAPVGLAWWDALKQEPGLVLHQADSSHPNPAGSYLAGCVLFATMFRRSPVGSIHRVPGRPVDLSGHVLETGFPVSSSASEVELVNLRAEQARALQEVAWRAVESFNVKEEEAVQSRKR